MNIIRKFYKHTLIYLVATLTAYYLIGNFFYSQKNNYTSTQTNLYYTKYETQYKYFKIIAEDIHHIYADNKNFINIFSQAKDANTTKKAQLRYETHEMLKKRYKRLKNIGVSQIQLFLPDNTSFLRMDNINKFGDDLSKVRTSITLANLTKKELAGFEYGQTTNAFRFIFPLFDKNNKYIGGLEISFSDQRITENITDKFILQKHMIYLGSELENLSNLSLYKKSPIENFFLEKYINDEIGENIPTITQKHNEPFSLDIIHNFNHIVATYIPIKAASSSKNVAYLSIYTDSAYLNNLHTEKAYINLLSLSIFTLIYLFSIYASIVQDKLRQMAHYDKLTHLPNRAYFYIALGQEIRRAKRNKEKFSIMFIDLDGFKAVNDNYGHDTGDELLVQVAIRLENNVRKADTVGRVGGDEFIILLSNVKSFDDSVVIANKMIESLNEDFTINKKIINIGASIGISNYPQNATKIDDIIKNADDAMYVAKNNGKNNVVVSDTINKETTNV